MKTSTIKLARIWLNWLGDGQTWHLEAIFRARAIRKRRELRATAHRSACSAALATTTTVR